MTNDTLPKLNWTEYLALKDTKAAEVAELSSRSEQPEKWTIQQYASNAHELLVTEILTFVPFKKVDPELYADTDARCRIIELLREADASPKTIKRLESI